MENITYIILFLSLICVINCINDSKNSSDIQKINTSAQSNSSIQINKSKILIRFGSQIQKQRILPQDYEIRTFQLQFSYGCWEQAHLLSCRANVFWNGLIVYVVRPIDYLIHTVNLRVNIKYRRNTLSFIGFSDFKDMVYVGNPYIKTRVGLTISDIELKRSIQAKNIIINGNFSEPLEKLSVQKSKFNFIKGWRGRNIEIGKSQLYNKNWLTQYVCLLNGEQNSLITQEFDINSKYLLSRPNWFSCNQRDYCYNYLKNEKTC